MGNDWGAVASGHHLPPPPSSLSPHTETFVATVERSASIITSKIDTHRNDAWFCICQVFGESEIVLGMKTTRKAALHAGVPTTSGQSLSVVDNIAGTVQIDHLKVRHNFIVVNSLGYPTCAHVCSDTFTWAVKIYSRFRSSFHAAHIKITCNCTVRGVAD